MESNETRTLWISVGSGLFAIFLLYSYSQEKKAEYDKRYGTSKRVVTAAKDIAEMQTIDDSMLDVQERPVDFIEPSAISIPEDAVGQVASSPIKKGEQILLTKLLTPGPDTGMALQVAPGKRALALPIDEFRGVAKLIKPGDRIDLLAALDIGKGKNLRREVKTIMQDVIVLATGVNIVHNIPRLLDVSDPKAPVYERLKGSTTFSSMTIEVSPKEAQALVAILTTAPGNLYAILRNPNDRSITPLRPTNIESIMSGGGPLIRRQRKPASRPKLVPQAPPVRKRSKSKKRFVPL